MLLFNTCTCMYDTQPTTQLNNGISMCIYIYIYIYVYTYIYIYIYADNKVAGGSSPVAQLSIDLKPHIFILRVLSLVPVALQKNTHQEPGTP